MLLSILVSNAIALPLSPSFPTGELKYIMDNSRAKVLLSTERFENKATQIVEAGLEREPRVDVMKKILKGGSVSNIEFEHLKDQAGGMMLYTSGTTSRPVCSLAHCLIRVIKLTSVERCIDIAVCPHSSSSVTIGSLEV